MEPSVVLCSRCTAVGLNAKGQARRRLMPSKRPQGGVSPGPTGPRRGRGAADRRLTLKVLQRSGPSVRLIHRCARQITKLTYAPRTLRALDMECRGMSNGAELGISGMTVRVGQREVSSIALGCMGLSYHGVLDDDYGVKVIKEALDRGVTLIDTADVYGPYGAPGTSERLVNRALGGWLRDTRHIIVATKGGHIRNRDDSISRVGRPEYLKRACEASLRALNVQTIDLYQLHGPDKEVPFADSVGALAELQKEGKIRDIGLSNVGRAHIEIARELVEVVSVQNRFSPLDRSSARVMEYCGQHGIAFLCWGPLAGLRAEELPRLVPELGVVGSARGATAYQVALAWEMALAPGVIPVVGAMSRTDIARAMEACDLDLSTTELTLISRGLPK